jgi:LmbE family N-acetylglucosaminyl deacetylase
MMTILFERRTGQKTISSEDPAKVWTHWQGEKEVWLFISPHDDDIVCGAGLTFLAAVQNQIEVHAAVISNGRMGYCSPEQRQTIAQIRKEETQNSFVHLGLPKGKLYQFDYDDGNLFQEMGRRFAKNSTGSQTAASQEIAGGIGLQNTLTWLLRKVRPTRVFLPNRLDLHPDHKAVYHETVISVFHAQGGIWPELGQSIEIPLLYEYATYSDFITEPTLRVCVPDAIAERRLEAIALYKSQLQIDLLVEELRKAGGNEYLLETTFKIFKPSKYEHLFQ